MAMACNSGLTVLGMKGTGKKVRPVVKEYFTTQMAIFLKVSGWRTKRTASEHTSTKMEQAMKDSGKMISSTVKAKSTGKMGANTSAATKWELNMGQVNIGGRMAATM